MDSDNGFFNFFSKDGEFSLQLCSDTNCCQTEALENEDDNWEVGQVDTFVGRRQLGNCFGFEVGDNLRLTVYHRGKNPGRLTWVRVAPWHQGLVWHCQVDVELGFSSSHTTDCELKDENR